MKELPDGHRALEPPDTISNSEVKRCIADGSVGSPHVRVGHYQALFFYPNFYFFSSQSYNFLSVEILVFFL